jgi:RHS repeat-associated protein
LVTISDKKLAVSSNGNTVDYYTADVVTAQDYYPFGMTQPGRKFNAGTQYRYGFNGKELDNSTGEGNLDFGARIYDNRLGRWLALDPLMKKYPGESPFLFCGGNPIIFSDPNGEDRIIRIYETKNGVTAFKMTVTYKAKGEYWWGKASNRNIHIKYNTTQEITFNYDKMTNGSPEIIKGAVTESYSKQDGIMYDDLGKLFETAKNKLGFGEDIPRGGYSLTASTSTTQNAASEKNGVPSGSINVDYVAVLTYLVASPTSLEEGVLTAGGAAVSLFSTKDEKGKPYVPESVTNTLEKAGGKTDAGKGGRNKSNTMYCTTCGLPQKRNKKTGKFEVSNSTEPVKDTGDVYDHTDTPRPKK